MTLPARFGEQKNSADEFVEYHHLIQNHRYKLGNGVTAIISTDHLSRKCKLKILKVEAGALRVLGSYECVKVNKILSFKSRKLIIDTETIAGENKCEGYSVDMQCSFDTEPAEYPRAQWSVFKRLSNDELISVETDKYAATYYLQLIDINNFESGPVCFTACYSLNPGTAQYLGSVVNIYPLGEDNVFFIQFSQGVSIVKLGNRKEDCKEVFKQSFLAPVEIQVHEGSPAPSLSLLCRARELNYAFHRVEQDSIVLEHKVPEAKRTASNGSQRAAPLVSNAGFQTLSLTRDHPVGVDPKLFTKPSAAAASASVSLAPTRIWSESPRPPAANSQPAPNPREGCRIM